MKSLDGVSTLAKDSLGRYMRIFYPVRICQIEDLEDMPLATQKRSAHADIGTGSIRLDMFNYITKNIAWINVCLFINADFRSCFNDAILIEKALLVVTRDEYNAFREDMELASDKDNMERNKVVPVDIGAFDPNVDRVIGQSLNGTWRTFCEEGMSDVYYELANGISGDDLKEVSYVAQNLLYFINALNRNGVFAKYVKIVIENVKKQLGIDS